MPQPPHGCSFLVFEESSTQYAKNEGLSYGFWRPRGRQQSRLLGEWGGPRHRSPSKQASKQACLQRGERTKKHEDRQHTLIDPILSSGRGKFRHGLRAVARDHSLAHPPERVGRCRVRSFFRFAPKTSSSFQATRFSPRVVVPAAAAMYIPFLSYPMES